MKHYWLLLVILAIVAVIGASSCEKTQLAPLTNGQKARLSNTVGETRGTYSGLSQARNLGLEALAGLDLSKCVWEGDSLPAEGDVTGGIFDPKSPSEKRDFKFSVRTKPSVNCPIVFNFNMAGKIDEPAQKMSLDLKMSYEVVSQSAKEKVDVQAMVLELSVAGDSSGASISGSGFIESRRNGHVDIYLAGGATPKQSRVTLGFVFSDFTAEISWVADENNEKVYLNGQETTEEEIAKLLSGRFEDPSSFGDLFPESLVPYFPKLTILGR